MGEEEDEQVVLAEEHRVLHNVLSVLVSVERCKFYFWCVRVVCI